MGPKLGLDASVHGSNIFSFFIVFSLKILAKYQIPPSLKWQTHSGFLEQISLIDSASSQISLMIS